jgi:hypothetical protein
MPIKSTCEICDKPNRPIINAKVRYTKGNLDYDMVVSACMKCLFEAFERERDEQRLRT